MPRKIAVFTGTRAEYGILFWLMKDLKSDEDFELQIIATGMHLSPEFGLTWEVIEQDGFEIDEKIEILLSSDTAIGTAKSIGLGVLSFTDAFSRLKPDVMIILGDRFEALAAAQTAMILRIPVLHLHGGEITEGAYDDAIRHAITKLSYLHGTSTEEYRRRVIQMGESPDRVVNVGAPGLDHITRSDFLSLAELGESLSFPISKPYFIITYHPVTLSDEPASISFKEILNALDYFLDHQVIITYPNADDGGRQIIPLIEEYANKNKGRVLAIRSMGQKRYLSAAKYASAVIGNSSSGIIEIPSFKIPTIDVGMRQKGRIHAESVLHVQPDADEIVKTISLAISDEYKTSIKNVVNPYGQSDSSKKIIRMLKNFHFTPEKKFYDLK